MKKADKNDLGAALKRLAQIATWFEEQNEADVEAGLEKVKEASGLIKSVRGRLKEIENEFEEVKAKIKE